MALDFDLWLKTLLNWSKINFLSSLDPKNREEREWDH